MLFETKIDPMCTYCARGVPLANGQVACPKKGVVSPDWHCRAFQYDPLKRVPPRPAAPQTSRLTPEDFAL